MKCLAALVAALLVCAEATRVQYNLNVDWKFQLQGGPAPTCSANTSWPINLDGQQCTGLSQADSAIDAASCLDICCGACIRHR